MGIEDARKMESPFLACGENMEKQLYCDGIHAGIQWRRTAWIDGPYHT
jgi:hypothetical protein